MVKKIQPYVAWGAIAAAIIIIILAVWTSPSYQECKAEASKQHSPQQKEEVPTQFFSTPVIWRCTGHFIDKNDPIITALATLVIAVFTIVLAFVTNRQAKLTKEALIADKRAFVFASGLNPTWEINQNTGQFDWRFRVTWQNSGDTPTRKMLIYIDCELRSTRLNSGFNFEAVSTVAPPGKGLLGPRAAAMSGPAPHLPGAAITPQDIAEVQAVRKFIYIWGWVRYFDVFPKTEQHITRFCWMILPNGDPFTYVPGQNPTGHESLSFSYIIHSEGNCADEECST